MLATALKGVMRSLVPYKGLPIVKVRLLCLLMTIACFGHAVAGTGDKSDLNGDSVVDLVDLAIFSNKYIEQNIEDVEWCDFYESVSTEKRLYGKPTSYYSKHFRVLLGFINDYFFCESGPLLLALKNDPESLTRMAHDAEGSGNTYISDPKVGSVFIYDQDLLLAGELKNLDRPLGVAIDSQGYLLVGNDGRDNVEVYDPRNGDLLAAFGQGLIQMPSAISIGPKGEIYVVDSNAHQVWVFEPSYLHMRTIGIPGSGDGQLKFPTDAEVVARQDGESTVEELFISDQFNRRIKVFDLWGNYLRAFEPLMTMSTFCGRFSPNCPEARGTFVRLQSLEFDSFGRLHSLDVMEASVTMIDPVTGDLLGSYGGWGDGPGLVRTPLDLTLTAAGEAIISDSNSPELEIYVIPPE